MKQIIKIFLFALISVSVSCEKELIMGEVSGTVHFAGTKIPVTNAQISVGPEIEYTNVGGIYRVRLPLGKYLLSAEKEGFDSYTEEIKIVQGNLDVDFEMASSEFTSIVFGYIRGNHTGAPQSGLRIMMLNPDDTESAIQDLSDARGEYQLDGIPHGDRMIVVIEDDVIIFQELLILDETSYELNIFLPEPFTFIDPRDNHEYWALKIGYKTWMIENLAWLPKVSGPKNGSYSEPFYYVFEYFGSSVEEARSTSNYWDYGVLYNWEAARISCPEGWHLPSDDEWQVLELYLGLGLFDTYSDGARLHGEVGRKLRSTTGWNNNGNGDNSSKFNILPVGSRFDSGGFDEFGFRATLWTSTPSSPVFAWTRGLGGNVHWIDRDRHDIQNGLSVRCVKN